MVANSETSIAEKIKLSKASALALKTIVNQKKIKKKLNKRQRSIKKKVKKLQLKKNQNLIKTVPDINTKELLVNSVISDNNVPTTKLTPAIVYDIKNPNNYSANWEKLKSIMMENNKNNMKTIKNISNEEIKVESKIFKEKIENKKLKSSGETLKSKIPNENFKCETIVTSKLQDFVQKNESLSKNTKIVALDCEMVGGGFNGEDNILARVSIVDHNNTVLYDEHVKPQERVIDYRTHVSGIRPSDLKNAKSYSTVQKEVSDVLSGCIIVGHALSNDFKCLLLSPPRYMIRDTSKFKPFIKLFNGGTPGLKKLSAKVLGVEIQTGEHNSVQDAQAAMQLYMLHRKEFEEKYSKRLLRGRTKRGKSSKKKNVKLDGKN